MARNRIQVKAPRPAVFAILADPQRYPEWVLGAGEVSGGFGARRSLAGAAAAVVSRVRG